MTEQKKANSSSYLTLILAALVMGAVLLLFFQNNRDAEIVLFFQRVTMSLSFLIFFCIFLGFLLGFLMMLPGRWRLYRSNKKLKKEMEGLRENQYISAGKNDGKTI